MVANVKQYDEKKQGKKLERPEKEICFGQKRELAEKEL